MCFNVPLKNIERNGIFLMLVKNCFITVLGSVHLEIWTCSDTWAKDSHELTRHRWMERDVSGDADCSETLSLSLTRFFNCCVGTSCMLFTAAFPLETMTGDLRTADVLSFQMQARRADGTCADTTVILTRLSVSVTVSVSVCLFCQSSKLGRTAHKCRRHPCGVACPRHSGSLANFRLVAVVTQQRRVRLGHGYVHHEMVLCKCANTTDHQARGFQAGWRSFAPRPLLQMHAAQCFTALQPKDIPFSARREEVFPQHTS